MPSAFHIPALALLSLYLVACSDTPGDISRDAKPFDGIAKTAEVTASGTEPFWNLRISPSTDGFVAYYTAPELPDGQRFGVARFAGNNGLGFSGRWGDMAVNLTLTPGTCSDGMSETSYPYTATLLLGDETRFGCADTSDEPAVSGATD